MRNHDENEFLDDFLSHLNRDVIHRDYNSYSYYDNVHPNIDNMTYEELLELQDKIGHVSKGLGDEEKKVDK